MAISDTMVTSTKDRMVLPDTMITSMAGCNSDYGPGSGYWDSSQSHTVDFSCPSQPPVSS